MSNLRVCLRSGGCLPARGLRRRSSKCRQAERRCRRNSWKEACSRSASRPKTARSTRLWRRTQKKAPVVEISSKAPLLEPSTTVPALRWVAKGRPPWLAGRDDRQPTGSYFCAAWAATAIPSLPPGSQDLPGHTLQRGAGRRPTPTRLSRACSSGRRLPLPRRRSGRGQRCGRRRCSRAGCRRPTGRCRVGRRAHLWLVRWRSGRRGRR
jgi:hypothetical protein